MTTLSPLGRFAQLHNIAPAEFAARIGVSRSHGHDLITGRRSPSATLALRIEAETGFPADQLNPAVAAVRAQLRQAVA